MSVWGSAAIAAMLAGLSLGAGAGSMHALQPLNLKTLTVTKVGDFSGCPPIDGGASSVALR